MRQHYFLKYWGDQCMGCPPTANFGGGRPPRPPPRSPPLTVAFLERKVLDYIPPTLWPPNSPDLNPVYHSIWSVLQQKVYQSTIANVSELDNSRERFVQSIVDAAIVQWGCRINACVCGSGHTLITKHKGSTKSY